MYRVPGTVCTGLWCGISSNSGDTGLRELNDDVLSAEGRQLESTRFFRWGMPASLAPLGLCRLGEGQAAPWDFSSSPPSVHTSQWEQLPKREEVTMASQGHEKQGKTETVAAQFDWGNTTGKCSVVPWDSGSQKRTLVGKPMQPRSVVLSSQVLVGFPAAFPWLPESSS